MIDIVVGRYSKPELVEISLSSEKIVCASAPQAGGIESILYEEW